MIDARQEDKQFLLEFEKDKLVNLLLMHLRNYWAVDGLYFLGIEKRYGTESATEIDAEVWKAMASIEARRLRKTMMLEKKGVAGVMEALRLTGWALDLENKEIKEENREAFFINHECRVQNIRLSKSLDAFPCKPVRFGYLERFVEEIDPEVSVECVACPPDQLPQGVWCSWRIYKKRER